MPRRLRVALIGKPLTVTTRQEKPTFSSVQTQTETVILDKTIIPDKTRSQAGLVITRPKRTIRKPLRFRDSDHVNPDQISFSDSEDVRSIKRVLAQRHTTDGIQYLVQQAGEPAQNAIWVLQSDLNAKAKQHVTKRPPPLV